MKNLPVELFSAYFMASSVKPKSEKVLKEIHQGEKETLREYIERFNEEALNIIDLHNKMRWWFMIKGLRPRSQFEIDVGAN